MTADGRARVLADGNEIPLLGLGVWQIPTGPSARTPSARRSSSATATSTPRRRTATRRSVGRALRDSGVPRDDVFVTTKFYPGSQDPEAEAERSLERLGVDQLDLYIIHWPQGGPTWAWEGMQRAKERGYARSIGISNFSLAQVDEVLGVADTPPAVNQVQFNPFAYRRALLEGCEERGIALEAYSPLGTGRHLGDERVAEIAERVGRTPAQVLLRWCLQRDLSSCRSRATASASRRTPRSSTSPCPTRTWPPSTRSMPPAAPTRRTRAPGGEDRLASARRSAARRG